MFCCITTIFSLLTEVYITIYALKSVKINILLFMQVLLNCLLLLFNVVLCKVLPVTSDGSIPILNPTGSWQKYRNENWAPNVDSSIPIPRRRNNALI